ncbi:MAG: hypothetical protein ACTSYD_14930 [Candidatus Heimdallarchaeaceae archaeon]
MIDFSVLYNKLQHELTKLESPEVFFKILPDLRVYAVNFKSKEVLKLLRSYRKKIEPFATPKMLFYLLELECRQIYHTKESLMVFEEQLVNMEQLLNQIDSLDCIALYEHLLWTFYRLRNDTNKAYSHLTKAWEIVANNHVSDYTRYFIQYSYTIERISENKVERTLEFLEECLDYYSKADFCRGVIRTFGWLGRIAIGTKRQQYALEIVERLNKSKIQKMLEKLPENLKALYHFHLAVIYKNNYYLKKAEEHLKMAYTIFSKIDEVEQHGSYFIRILIYLATCYYLIGRQDLGKRFLNNLKTIMNKRKNHEHLDDRTILQVKHELTVLDYFLSYRRNKKKALNPKLIKTIYEGCQKYYTDPILLGFFILTAPLSTEQLERLYETPKASLKRVLYIIDYKIQKIRDDFEFKDYERRINCLGVFFRYNLRRDESEMERFFMDALFIRELLYYHKFEEATIVLNRHKEHLEEIEIEFIRKLYKRNLGVLKKKKKFKIKKINVNLV